MTPGMSVTVRLEAGYDLALYGMSLSFKDRAYPPDDWWAFCHKADCDTCGFSAGCSGKLGRFRRMARIAETNANRGGGHNKFRRQIMLWLDIELPRYVWSELDTYKVGTTAQSESTMHTLLRRPMTLEDCEPDAITLEMLEFVNERIERARDSKVQDIRGAKQVVPESYLQRRLVTCNYEVLAAIINQRRNHRLPQWKSFIDSIYAQVAHPELLPERLKV
jgi:hypothetical protein